VGRVRPPVAPVLARQGGPHVRRGLTGPPDGRPPLRSRGVRGRLGI
jgi:hypothetical protein